MISRLRRSAAGMTLIEVVMVIVILSIMALVAGPLLAVAVEAIDLKINRTHLKEEGDYALARITREIRRIRDMESILTASASEFRFYDIEGDDIQFTISGDALTRREGAAATAQEMIDNVTALNFTYYYSGDSDVLTAIATPQTGSGTLTDIQLIEIEIELTNGDHVVTLKTQVQPFTFTTEADLFL